MPKRRSTVSRNRPSKRSRFTKIPLRALPNSIRPETKFRDITIATLNVLSSVNLRPFLQGTDGDEFIGTKCWLKSFDYTCEVDPTYNGNCRTTVLIPKDPSVTPTALTPNLRYSHDDFWVLHDEIWSGKEKSSIRIKMPLERLQTFNTSATTVLSNDVFIVNNAQFAIDQLASARLYWNDP